jgi:hypothetical protein
LPNITVTYCSTKVNKKIQEGVKIMSCRPIKPLPENLPQWVPKETVADTFGASVNYVTKWCRLGALDAKKIKGKWYIHRADLLEKYASGEGLTLRKRKTG